MSAEAPRPVRLGIIGCGAVTQQYYTRVLPLVHEARVVGVSDLDNTAARLVGNRLDARVLSTEALLATVSTVIVATPPHTHYEIIRRSLESGVDVISEKPFVGSASEARDLVALARARSRRLHVAQFRRCYPAVQAVRRILASGALGAIRKLVVLEGGRYTWATESGYVGRAPLSGVLHDTGSHAIDMALYAAGLECDHFNVEVLSVHRDQPEPADSVDARVHLSSAIRQVDCDVRLSRFRALANRIRLETDAATLEISTRLRNAIRLTGPHGTTVLTVPSAIVDPMQCFVEELKIIFSPGRAMFDADSVTLLTSVLESIHSAPA